MTNGTIATPTPAPAAPPPPTIPPGTPGPDLGVAVAFSLGWQVASLYSDPHSERPDERPVPEDLPGLGALTDSQRTRLGLDQIDAGLHRLEPRIGAAGLRAPDRGPLRRAFEGQGGSDALREALLALHLDVLRTLTAADFRLGKAYGLGRTMADTCRVESVEQLRQKFQHWRLEDVRTWLADLDSALPPHAAKPTRESLRAWEEWVGQPQVGDRPLDWSRDGDTVQDCLHRQGQRWRSLLSGEKAGKDMLHAQDYIHAVGKAMSQAPRAIGNVLLGTWPFVVLALVLIGGAAVALATSNGATANIAAIAALATSVGVSWKGVGTALGSVASRLQEPLWGAAMNDAITTAINEIPKSPDDTHGVKGRAVSANPPSPSG